MFLNDRKGTSVHRLLPLDATDVSSFPVSRPGAAVGGTGGSRRGDVSSCATQC